MDSTTTSFPQSQRTIPDIEEGTDVWALNRGLISITPLRLEVTDDKLIPALSEHTRRLESGLKQMM